MYKKRFGQLFSDSRNRAAIIASSVIMLVCSPSLARELLVLTVIWPSDGFLLNHPSSFKYTVTLTRTDNASGSTAMWKFVHPILL